MVSSVFPVVILLSSYISVQINNGLTLHSGVIIVSVLLLVIAFIITLGLSRLILNPLKKLTLSSKNIQNGDYKTKVGIGAFKFIENSSNKLNLSIAFTLPLSPRCH